MLQHILLDLRIGCPILKFGHIHIFQRELNPNLFRVDLTLGKQDNCLNGTFIVPTKFLYFPVSKIHWKTELYVLQESAIWLLLLVNVHLFHKTVKKFFLLQVGELII